MSIIHTIFINVKREYRRAILPKYESLLQSINSLLKIGNLTCNCVLVVYSLSSGLIKISSSLLEGSNCSSLIACSHSGKNLLR